MSNTSDPLATNWVEGLPVRVIRGSAGDHQFAPPLGYRYDGLFRVVRCWREIGRSGFNIWRFRLLQIAELEVTQAQDSSLRERGEDYTARRLSTIQRIVRSNEIIQAIEVLYDYRCQVCGIRLMTLGGPYAEGAHIRPLGTPHRGEDEISNLLCLCPNDHVRLDYGTILITSDFTIIDRSTEVPLGRLHVDPAHNIDIRNLEYHRDMFMQTLPTPSE